MLEKIDVDWRLWFGESIVTFVKVREVRFDVAFRSKRK
jgi:hypothetical protein